MTRYPGLTGTVVFMRNDEIIGKYKISTKASVIISPAVLYENVSDSIAEYVEGKKANIHVYANGEIEILLTDREDLPHKLNVKANHVVELVTDVSKRLEVSKDTRVYIFGRKVTMSISPAEKGFIIYLHRNKDAYELLKPVIEKLRKERAIVI